eukprot:jgi/Psemu1/62805/estExt_Genemark1.C_90098
MIAALSSPAEALADKPTAIVIGAGPVGLSTSLGLSRRGWRVILVEKFESFDVRGASFGLGPHGAKALEEIHPGTVQQGMIESGRGMPVPGGTLLIPWWMMRDALLERVRERVEANAIDLRMGLSIESISDEGDESGNDNNNNNNNRNGNRVTARFTNGETIEGDVLIGADGVHSSVRKILGLPPTEVTGSKVYRGTVDVQGVCDKESCADETETSKNNLPSDDASRLQQLLPKGVAPLVASYPGMYLLVFNFHSHIPGRMCWVFTITNKDFDAETMDIRSIVKETEKDEEKLASILAIFGSSSEESVSSYLETRVADFSDDTLSRFDGRWGGKGRVTLIGDAAHAMRPTDGQGGNMGFEDAIVLCRLLGSEDVCTSTSGSSPTGARTEAIEDILGKFERMRLPRVKKVHDNQRLRYEARQRGEQIGRMAPEFKEWVENGV